MEDFEIDVADPVERCRRRWEALGLDEDSGEGNQVADSGQELHEDAEVAANDGSRHPSMH